MTTTAPRTGANPAPAPTRIPGSMAPPVAAAAGDLHAWREVTAQRCPDDLPGSGSGSAYPITLPDPTRLPLDDTARVRDHLQQLASARQGQLDNSRAPAPGEIVTSCYRDTLTQMLTQIRQAIAALDAGTYGRCVDCGCPISRGRLQLRPWSVTCSSCVSQRRTR